MEDFNAGITGLGVYLPEKRMTEQDFINAGVPKEKIDEWGVYEHRVSEPDEAPSDMSIKAARNLIENTGIDPTEIDLIIDSALVPDYILPGNSHRIQYEIGAKNAATIDILPSGGGGIIPSLIMAKAMITTNVYNKVLITCSSKITPVADKKQYLASVVCGDGSGAVLVSTVNKECGILSSNMMTRGDFFSHCGIAMKDVEHSTNKRIVYENDDDKKKLLFFLHDEDITEGEIKNFYEYFSKCVPLSAELALGKVGLTFGDVDFWIMHQNSKAFAEDWIKRLGIKKRGNYHLTYEKYGNLFNANLLINLGEALERKLIKDNDIVVLTGAISGLSAGSIVMRWGK